MPVARMKMRPWLEKVIESNKVPGLSWVDKDQKMFSITWMHAARHGWQMDKDASLFKLWAIHTGKFKEGVDDSDPKKWKANFRCAMNSLPDVEQVKCKSVNKGQQAVRVYRMMAVTTVKDDRTKTKEGKRRNKVARSEMDFSDTQSCADQHPELFDDTCSQQENTVDSTEQDMVTDVENTITIGLDSADDLFRFEVSPKHSAVFEDTEEIIKLCQELEQDSNTGLLNHELYSDANSSPHSPWSDTSSGDEMDMRLYAVLGAGNVSYFDDPWASSTKYYCPL